MVNRIPKNRPPFHPGEILKEMYLDEMGMSQTALAEKIGCKVTKVNEIVKGKRGVTADFALDLADALGTSAELWVNLQATYDLWEAIQKRKRA